MAEIKWIKIATEIFDNKKIKMIEAMPEGDAIIVIWFKILMLAGKTNDYGYVYFAHDIPFTDQMLATFFNKPLTIVQLALNTFVKFHMIEIVDDVILVSNWEEYQNIEGMEKIREQTRKRVAKHRESKRLEKGIDECNVTGNVTVTHGNATDIDKDIDKELDKDKKNIYSSLFEETYKAYPRKEGKKKAYGCYLARLKEGYTEEELLTAAKNYAEFCIKDKRETKYIKLASTFFGVNNFFVDYLKGDSENEGNNTGDSGESKTEFTEEQRQAARDYLSGVQRGGLFD